jgi:photosystem II stability/assembly factor-like uncharacterized protein
MIARHGRLTRGVFVATVLAAAIGVAPLQAQAPRWTNVTGNLAYKVSECGGLTVLSAVPKSEAVIAGVAARGLWVNTSGTSWERLSDPDSPRILNRPTHIVYDPENPAIFWESGMYGLVGIYRTNDGGKTFAQVGDIFHNDSFSVDFTDPDRQTILAGGHEQGQMVYASINGGKTWKNVGATLPAGSGFSTHPFVVNAMVYLVNVSTPEGSPLLGIYRSTDAGKSWQRVSPYGPPGPVLRTEKGVLYWTTPNRVNWSTDHGATWASTVVEGLRPVRPVELPNGSMVVVGPTSLLISSDGNATWTPLGGPLPYQPDGLIYSPLRKSFFIWRSVCNDHVAANAVMKLDFGS